MQRPRLPQSINVLIVDDQDAARRLLRRILTTAGFTVEEAKDGFAAVAAAKVQRPDVILLDGDMPVLDGYDACRILKTHAETWSIPIIFVTALGDSAHRDRGLNAGASAYLTKPVDPHQLIAQVQAVIEQSG